jgi:hypothetical protein
MPLTDDEIKALLQGCEGVTPGPWATEHGFSFAVHFPEPFPEIALHRDHKPATAAHIARCDPGTIAELCTRVLEAEARVKVLGEALEAWHSAIRWGGYDKGP